MKDEENKLGFFRIVIGIIILACFILVVQKGIELLQNIAQICVVEQGSLRFEESAEGYILREEVVMQG